MEEVMNPQKKHSPAKHIILAIAVALVAVFFVVYATSTLYPAQDRSDFCGDYDKPRAVFDTQPECEAAGGQWDAYPSPRGDGPEGYCNADFTCSQDYQDAREVYERNIFFVNIIIGLIVLVASFFLTLEAVSNGFMAGGAIMIIYGSIRYWGNLSNIWRTLMLGVALAVLVWVGYRKLR
jgi:hypothetical protein